EVGRRMDIDDELPVQAGYTLWADFYDTDGNPLIALEGPAMAAWFGDLRGRQALDLGCGTGRHTRGLVEAGASVVAADLTPAMMGRARAKLAGCRVDWLRLALPGPLPFADATFALAVLGLVAEHVVDLGASLAEVARVLQPGGRCLLSALHPDRTAEGQSARFIDPETGVRRPIRTVHRTIGDYLAAGDSAGLKLVEERTLVVPEGLARSLPRALPYVGKSLGWVVHWMR
ncbi:MAG TPA: class I SAM-dependent methyltransferase, partial [Isosphaeraceae bacterium]